MCVEYDVFPVTIKPESYNFYVQESYRLPSN